MKFTKRLLAYITLVAMVASIYTDATIVYGQSLSTSFISSYYDQERIEIEIRDDKLNFLDLPNREGFEQVLVFLGCLQSDGTLVYSKAKSLKAPFSFDLSGFEDGVYFVQLYNYVSSDGNKRNYTSYWHGTGGPKIISQNKTWNFVESDTYENNYEKMLSRRSDSLALNYYLKPSSGVESDNSEICALAEQITTPYTDDYNKYKAIHDWLCNNIWYDYDYFYSRQGKLYYSATEVLEGRRTVCGGYANLAAALCRAAGIPCKVTDGYGMGLSADTIWNEENMTQSNHAWNEAYINGRWVIMDATWDSSNKYENGIFSEGTGLFNYNYFDPSISSFSYDHCIIDEIKDEIEEECTSTILPNMESTLAPTKEPTPSITPTQNITPSIIPTLTATINPQIQETIKPTSSSTTTPSPVDLSFTPSPEPLGQESYEGVEPTASPQVSEEEKIEEPFSFVQFQKTIKKGRSLDLSSKLSGSAGKITWKSSNKKLAKVSQKGIVKGLKKGKVKITATRDDGKKCSVTIKIK